jgi:hypothetical protein
LSIFIEIPLNENQKYLVKMKDIPTGFDFNRSIEDIEELIKKG